MRIVQNTHDFLKIESLMSAPTSMNDTIAAIATATGKGGVGIVRLSGPDAYAIGTAITKSTLNPREAHYCALKDASGDILDHGIVLYFVSPHSYTGEDVVELQAHGGPVILGLLLKTAIKLGARMAKPGEFTERAFLNDKMDLAQAEAVVDLINSTTETAAKTALRSLSGEFSNTVQALLQRLIDIRMYIEAALDFPEEEIDFLSDSALIQRMNTLLEALQTVFQQSKQGQLIKDGMNVVILGQPNAGKSSLMNALSQENKAIVTDIAGTTRDVLENQIQIDGLPLNIIDTAGLRDTQDVVEAEGVKRAWQAVENADAVIVMIDASQGVQSQDNTILNQLPHKLPCLIGLNKIDLNPDYPHETGLLDSHPLQRIFPLSIETGEGLLELKTAMKEIMGYQQNNEGMYLARQRHLNALDDTLSHVQLAQTQLNLGMGELAAEELKLAQQHLGQITGEFTSDDLLGEIFSSFCIGK